MSTLISVAVKNHCYGTIRALCDVTCSISKESMTAVVGPNGGGKSTLIKLVAGLFDATDGQINRHGLKPSDIAYLAQRTEIDRTFPIKVEDVVAMGLWPKITSSTRYNKHHHGIIEDILDKVGLSGMGRRSISQLSGGQLQRLFFGRVMAQDAQLILLDEPFAGIDQPTVSHLIGLIQGWHKSGKTIVAVLHDINMVRNLFPETILIARSLISSGVTSQVLTPENLTKAAFNV
ncbi:MAG: metal ABC transporter ATP-binding protein [Candidatus Paracaedibacteraceae bacterium]|nr:metal ABC transporter ATP-binding protein [Candidatus Paracaedibacteraceae bacterium]